MFSDIYIIQRYVYKWTPSIKLLNKIEVNNLSAFNIFAAAVKLNDLQIGS